MWPALFFLFCADTCCVRGRQKKVRGWNAYPGVCFSDSRGICRGAREVCADGGADRAGKRVVGAEGWGDGEAAPCGRVESEAHMLDYLASKGGVVTRTWGTNNIGEYLDRAQRKGIGVIVGFWMGHERHGFDFSPFARGSGRERGLSTVDDCEDQTESWRYGECSFYSGEGVDGESVNRQIGRSGVRGYEMSDQETSVAELKESVTAFVEARDWERYHSPKNLAMSISIEAAEIMEHFQWLTVEEAKSAMGDEKVRGEVEAEIADVFIYCLSFADVTKIDVSEAIRRKLSRNEERFPVGRVRGYTVDGGESADRPVGKSVDQDRQED